MSRKKPYTQIGINRMKCWNTECSNRAQYQWQVCADGNIWRPVCLTCDVALNRAALAVMNDSNAEKKIRDYVANKYPLTAQSSMTHGTLCRCPYCGTLGRFDKMACGIAEYEDACFVNSYTKEFECHECYIK